jgi:hypothetical protein
MHWRGLCELHIVMYVQVVRRAALRSTHDSHVQRDPAAVVRRSAHRRARMSGPRVLAHTSYQPPFHGCLFLRSVDPRGKACKSYVAGGIVESADCGTTATPPCCAGAYQGPDLKGPPTTSAHILRMCGISCPQQRPPADNLVPPARPRLAAFTTPAQRNSSTNILASHALLCRLNTLGSHPAGHTTRPVHRALRAT